MIPDYPSLAPLALDMREDLHPLFCRLKEGISEFTFANLYLFNTSHRYVVSRLSADAVMMAGADGRTPFFMLPFGLPDDALLDDLLACYGYLKAVSEAHAEILAARGWAVEEDRDNFDYLYSREELATLAGRKFHKKKNLVNSFVRTWQPEAYPLTTNRVPDAIAVLDAWRDERTARGEQDGDYGPAREALDRMDELQLCGGIFAIAGEPVAYTLGEENDLGNSFLIHFEKAVQAERYKGIYQYVNQAFASFLPDKYATINREQDLGDPGLRQAKESYRPVGFVRKFRVLPREA